MADKQAKLTAALRKRPSDDDDDVPPPPLVPTRRPEEIKLRKSNLNGTTSWEQCLALLELNLLHEYAVCVETLTKMLTNITANPSEPKFRRIRASNPSFAAKVYSMTGAPELFTLAGFKDTVEEGFLVLPDGADLALVQRAIDSLAAQQAGRREEEEKQRQLRQRREREAREPTLALALALAQALTLALSLALPLSLTRRARHGCRRRATPPPPRSSTQPSRPTRA
jgi:hypothetical protein